LFGFLCKLSVVAHKCVYCLLEIIKNQTEYLEGLEGLASK